MIKFEKVSYEEYRKSLAKLDYDDTDDEFLRKEYEDIKLPKRATKGSAGYDFYAPFSVSITDRFYCHNDAFACDKRYAIPDYITFPTGIRLVTNEPDIVLILVPRSGLGFKNGTRLANTVGVIDSDYQYADNEGHIMIKMRADEKVDIPKGKAFMQGVLLRYFTVDSDKSKATRKGGFGSTDK